MYQNHKGVLGEHNSEIGFSKHSFSVKITYEITISWNISKILEDALNSPCRPGDQNNKTRLKISSQQRTLDIHFPILFVGAGHISWIRSALRDYRLYSCYI
ncbi:hypothetical protein HI914_03894 [Erysiphe necator]|nr:hypothetical protein HI914_03894 [Erysiphe necator]